MAPAAQRLGAQLRAPVKLMNTAAAHGSSRRMAAEGCTSGATA